VTDSGKADRVVSYPFSLMLTSGVHNYTQRNDFNGSYTPRTTDPNHSCCHHLMNAGH